MTYLVSDTGCYVAGMLSALQLEECDQRFVDRVHINVAMLNISMHVCILCDENIFIFMK